MKTDIVMIDNQGKGYIEAADQTRKAAAFRGLSEKDTLQLQLITEETLSMVHSITGDMNAAFWIESAQGKAFEIHLTTKTIMDSQRRYELISSATSRKNEAAKSFLGSLRDAFERALLSGTDAGTSSMPDDVINDVTNRFIEDVEWDRYEQSILRRLADNIKIDIRGGLVNMTVSKRFEE